MDSREGLRELKEHVGYGSRCSQDANISLLRHTLMSEYGWIPEEEFYSRTSIFDLVSMVREINSSRKERKKAYERIAGGLK